jgi:hypothetical protein
MHQRPLLAAAIAFLCCVLLCVVAVVAWLYFLNSFINAVVWLLVMGT